MAVDINLLETRVIALEKQLAKVETLLSGAASVDQLARLSVLRQNEMEDIKKRLTTLETALKNLALLP